MGLATIDSHRKSLPRFTRFLSLVLIRLVFTEIQPFENVKIYKEMYGNPDAVRHLVWVKIENETKALINPQNNSKIIIVLRCIIGVEKKAHSK